MSQFIIKGGHKLTGTVRASGSKNAVLPILAAAIMVQNEVILDNVPDISDVRTMLHILETLGAQVHFEDQKIHIKTDKLSNKYIPHQEVAQMRASILLLGPLLARFGEVKLAFPGGCVIGRRPIDAHLDAFKQLGIQVVEDGENIHLKAKKISGKIVIMPEMSVTATENLIMAACFCEGTAEIHLAACEPHVQDLCKFLNAMGAKISGIGTHKLIIEGVNKLLGAQYKVCSDYLEVGTLALASVLTGGEVCIEDVSEDHLEMFLYKLWQMGVKFELKKRKLHLYPSKQLKTISNLKTAVHPGFPTDLQAPFAVLLTQVAGETVIFETLFEGRFGYLAELEQMGANVQIINPHQARIIGASPLKGLTVTSHDLRAGAAMVLAGLIAEGETQVSNINYIDRGYDNLDGKLRKLGAKIQRS